MATSWRDDVTFVHALDSVLWTLKDLGFYPLLLIMSLCLWFAVKDRADRLTSGIFSLSIIFALLWSLWWLQVLASVASGDPIIWERSGGLLGLMAVALVLFLLSAVRSSVAVAANVPVDRPVTTLYALIFAHAFHIAALFVLIVRTIDPAW